MDPYLHILLFLSLFLAAVIDILRRRIPNILTLSVMVMGIVYYIYLHGLNGFIYSAGGLLLGIGLLLPVYLIGGMGAGDVKLLGAVGSVLGAQGVFVAFLYSAIVGGVYALSILARNKVLSQTVSRYGLILKGYLCTGQLIYIPPDVGKLPPLCYGLAISLGTILVRPEAAIDGNEVIQTETKAARLQRCKS